MRKVIICRNTIKKMQVKYNRELDYIELHLIYTDGFEDTKLLSPNNKCPVIFSDVELHRAGVVW